MHGERIVTAESAKVCRRLLLACAVAIGAPMVTAAVLAGTEAMATPQEEPAATHHVTIADLGHARAVSWISTGHVAAP